MQYKTLSLLALSAAALAAPGPQNTDSLESNPEYQEYISSLDSAATQTDPAGLLPDVGIPTSVLAVLMTAMPASFVSQLADPSAVSALDEDWKNSKYPDWYSKLPGDVKDYVSSMYAEYDDATATATNSAEETGSTTGKGSSSSGSASATATSTGTSTGTGTSDASSSSSAAKTTDAQTTGSSSASGSSAAETTGSQGATSEGGAPAPTGAMAASLAGAAGILGLAIAL